MSALTRGTIPRRLPLRSSVTDMPLFLQLSTITRSARRCKIVGGRIVFCPLHEEAESLLALCQYLRRFIADVKVERLGDANLIREVVLPYADGVIGAALKIEKLRAAGFTYTRRFLPPTLWARDSLKTPCTLSRALRWSLYSV